MLKKTDNRGFTFIELIVYMAILGIFMAAVGTLISSTVASRKKTSSREKLQNQAVETYSTLSDMMMGATDVKIRGEAYVGSDATAYTKKDGNFVVIKENEIKAAPGATIYAPGGAATRKQLGSDDGVDICYDIADIKPFTATATPSADTETYIDVKYLMLKYASDIQEDATTKMKNSVYTYCTLKFDATAKCIYIYRTASATENYGNSTDILCKNVENFQLQVNPDTGTFAIILDFKDPKTGIKYSYDGVVSLRNSFVLKKHEWD